MDYDNSWDALLKPGDATTYFEGYQGRKFDPNAEGYSPGNAWWLAEMCRLIYKQGAGEPMPSRGAQTRQQILASVGHVENFMQHPLVQFALIKPQASNACRILIFRGSHDLLDWVTNFEAIPTVCQTGGQVHKGFQHALDQVWDSKIKDLLMAGSGPLFFTGHSLGAALATLAAARYGGPSQLYTFGSPLVGDKEFSRALENVKSYRIVNNRDVVATVPSFDGFSHLEELYYIAHNGEILRNPSRDIVAEDRMKRDHLPILSKDWHLHFTDAPEFLADHAPVNYVAHLERALQ